MFDKGPSKFEHIEISTGDISEELDRKEKETPVQRKELKVS